MTDPTHNPFAHSPYELELMRNKNLCNAITEAIREQERCPDDSIQDIWNEKLEDWKTGLQMDSSFLIEEAK